MRQHTAHIAICLAFAYCMSFITFGGREVIVSYHKWKRIECVV